MLAEIIDELGLPAGRSTWSPASARWSGRDRGPRRRRHGFLHRFYTGRRLVTEEAAKNVKRVSLELGGKSANVILDDADLKQAVAYGVANCFLNSGQTCSAHPHARPTREARGGRRRSPRRRRLSRAIFEEGSRMGPLVSDAQRTRVREFIAKGEQGGEARHRGADQPEGLESGYFVSPTVFSEVKPEMTIAQEEIFGPVLSIIL